MYKKILIFALSIFLILPLSSSYASTEFDSEQLAPIFHMNSNGEWIYQWSYDDYYTSVNMNFIITPVLENSYFLQNGYDYFMICGFVYDWEEEAFKELNGYKISIDGHTYNISDCHQFYSFDTSVGEIACPISSHPLLFDMLNDMRNAKKEIKIIYKVANGSREYEIERKLNSNDFITLRKMADSVCKSGFIEAHKYSLAPSYSLVTEYND